MSDYLIKEIEAAENIDVLFRTRVVGGGGDGRLEHLVLMDSESGRTDRVPAAALFVLIGGEPRTGWLPREIARDSRGYVITGPDLLQDGRPPRGWSPGRYPLPMETSMPGVFAAGDVVLAPGAARRVRELLGGEGGNLDPEQPARLQVLPGVAQESQRVVHAQEAKERVEGADAEPVPPAQLRTPHVSTNPLDG